MIKLFIFILLVFGFSVYAEGPLFRHKEPEKQQEYENVYKDLRSKPSISSPGNFALLNATQTWSATQNFKDINATTITGTGSFSITGSSIGASVNANDGSYSFLNITSGGTGIVVAHENAAGGSLLSGSLPNSGIIYQSGNFPIQIGINNGVVATFYSTGTAFLGTNTNNDAQPGYYGEYFSSSTLSTTITASGAFQVVLSTSLAPGDYDLTAAVTYLRNGATFTSTDFAIFISTALSSSTDYSETRTAFEIAATVPTTFASFNMTMPSVRVSISSRETRYLKVFADVFTAGNPKATARLSGRRVR